MYSYVLPDGTIPATIVLMANRYSHSVSLNQPSLEPSESRKPSGRRWKLVERGSHKVSRRESDPITRLSHDIRTQLYIIIGFAELMLDEVPGKINDDQRCNLNDVLNSGKRLVNMLNDIIARSESNSGKTVDDTTHEEHK
jgi:signal transduction histidine kinase